MPMPIDLVMVEHKLKWLYNAVEVDIDVEGVFASFIWDEWDENKYNVIMDFMYSEARLYEVDYQIIDETQEIIIYGFFMPLERKDNGVEVALTTEDADIEILDEKKTVIKVNSKGQRRRKVVCGTGKRWDGKRCVAMNSRQKLNIRKGKIKAKRTNRSKGSGKKRRTAMLRKRALKRRGQQGLGKK